MLQELALLCLDHGIQHKKRLWVHITPSTVEKANVTIAAARKPQLGRASEEHIGAAAGHSPLEDLAVISTVTEAAFTLPPSGEYEGFTIETAEDEVLISLILKSPMNSPAAEVDGFHFVDYPLSPTCVPFADASMTASIDFFGAGGGSSFLSEAATPDCSKLQLILNRLCRSFPFPADQGPALQVDRMAQSCPALLQTKA